MLINRFLWGKEKNIERDAFVWNMVAGLVNAAEAVLIMMIVTRIEGVASAGIFSIAFAVGNLLMNIGKYGVKSFQVTDAKNEYSFSDYYNLRVITVIFMLLATLSYLGINLFTDMDTGRKQCVTLFICLIYIVESFEDVFLGELQKKGRLDVASKVFILRWSWIMVSFSIITIVAKDSLLAIGAATLGSFFLEFLLIKRIREKINFLKDRQNRETMLRLIKQCFPLFLVSFLTYYVTNAPKYAIDGHLTEDIQGYFGYISMPVFVIELLNCFLYQPQMATLALCWEKKDYKTFNQRILRQIAYILLLIVICVVGAYILGIPILSLLYGVALEDYKRELIILMLAGGGLALVGFSGIVLTIQRKQNILLINTVIIAVLAFVSLGLVVEKYGMTGICIAFLVLMLVLAVLNYCCIIKGELEQQ